MHSGTEGEVNNDCYCDAHCTHTHTHTADELYKQWNYVISREEAAKQTNKCISYLLVPYPMSEYDFPEPVWPYANREQL